MTSRGIRAAAPLGTLATLVLVSCSAGPKEASNATIGTVQPEAAPSTQASTTDVEARPIPSARRSPGTLRLDGVVYRVLSLGRRAGVQGSSTGVEAAGVFVIVELAVTNTRAEAVRFPPRTVRLRTREGKLYRTDRWAALAFDNSLPSLMTLPPGASRRVVAAFDVPRMSARDGELLIFSPLSSKRGRIDVG